MADLVLVDMDKTYSTKLRMDDTTEKIFHAVQKALDSTNDADTWNIEIHGAWNSPITISVSSSKAEVIK